MAAEFIDTPTGLSRLCARLKTVAWIALDTEFMREKTYYARLCLIQIATGDAVACVDPLAVDIAPLLDVIYSPETIKVIHAARQDLELLNDLRGVPPAPVFDTQIAGALLGYDPQIGYGALVEALTGVSLGKAHTRTNWEARPLKPEQIRYAEDDVHYLCGVYTALTDKLDALDRSAWLREECAALTDPELYRNDPDQAYRRLRQGHRLPLAVQPVLRELAAWRERAAQTRNLPRGWVADDSLLMEIARAAPHTQADLVHVPGLKHGMAREWGGEILAAVATGRRDPPEALWPEPRRPQPTEQSAYRHAAACVHRAAEELAIAPTCVATRKDIQELIMHGGGALTRGWRRHVVGEKLLALRASGDGTTLKAP